MADIRGGVLILSLDGDLLDLGDTLVKLFAGIHADEGSAVEIDGVTDSDR
jgi:hypothetical protein